MRKKQKNQGWMIVLVVVLTAGSVAWWLTFMKPEETNEKEVKSQDAKEKMEDEQHDLDKKDKKTVLQNGDWKELLKNRSPLIRTYTVRTGINRNLKSDGLN